MKSNIKQPESVSSIHVSANDLDLYFRQRIADMSKQENALRLEIERYSDRLSRLKADHSKIQSNLTSLEFSHEQLKKDGVI